MSKKKSSGKKKLPYRKQQTSSNEIVKVLHEFSPTLEKTGAYPYRVSSIGGIVYIILRSKSSEKLNEGGMARKAMESIKALPAYANCSIQVSGAAYPVNPKNGSVVTSTGKSTVKPVYERRFRINNEVSIL